MLDNNSYYKYQEHRGQAGYRSAILVKRASETLYSLLCPSESAPSVFGTLDSFEFDLLNSPTKGKIQGKMALDDKEVEVLHHRDMVYRFEELKDQTLDFLVIDSEFVGYKFSGKISYRRNDATADVLRGTYTIVPMSADPIPVMNARPLCQETLCFAHAIPSTIKVGDTVELGVLQSNSATFAVKKYDEQNGTWGVDAAGITISGNTATAVNAGLYAITASATGYASWTTTVYIDSASAT